MSNQSLLEWLGFPVRESTYRDLLGWLIDTAGTAPLSALLGFEVGKVVNASLKKEQALEGAATLSKRSMRLDLFVETEHAVVGIEMKVHSSAGPGQLDGYARWLAGRANGKRAVLVFLTETGAIPEYPREFRERIQPVELRCITWDRIAEMILEDDPLGWRAEAIARAQEIHEHEETVCGEAPLPPLESPPTPRVTNVRARGVLALALRVAKETDLEHVMGPTFGSYNPDPQVDLAKPTWTVDLGYDNALFRRVNPFADARLRFTVRARFRENQRGEISLGIGSTFIPYPPDVVTKAKRAALLAEAAPGLERGLDLRRLLVKRMDGSSGMSDANWYESHILIKPLFRSRVSYAARALGKAIPIIDEVIAEWRGTKR